MLFAETEGFTIISAYVEVETGKGADALDRRPNSRLLWLREKLPNAACWYRSWTGCPATSPSLPV
jgi:hypothetical protein